MEDKLVIGVGYVVGMQAGYGVDSSFEAFSFSCDWFEECPCRCRATCQVDGRLIRGGHVLDMLGKTCVSVVQMAAGDLGPYAHNTIAVLISVAISIWLFDLEHQCHASRGSW